MTVLDEPRTSAPAPEPSRLGAVSMGLLVLSLALQCVSLVQQFAHLFSPRPGELPLVALGIGAAALCSVSAVLAGVASLRTPSRRLGAFGAALAAATLVLFAALTSFGFGFLEALSRPM